MQYHLTTAMITETPKQENRKTQKTKHTLTHTHTICKSSFKKVYYFQKESKEARKQESKKESKKEGKKRERGREGRRKEAGEERRRKHFKRKKNGLFQIE